MMLVAPTGRTKFAVAAGNREHLRKWHRRNFLAKCDQCGETIYGIRGHEQAVAANTGWMIRENGEAFCPLHQWNVQPA